MMREGDRRSSVSMIPDRADCPDRSLLNQCEMKMELMRLAAIGTSHSDTIPAKMPNTKSAPTTVSNQWNRANMAKL